MQVPDAKPCFTICPQLFGGFYLVSRVLNPKLDNINFLQDVEIFKIAAKIAYTVAAKIHNCHILTSPHLSRNPRGGGVVGGTNAHSATSSLHLPLSSAALCDAVNSNPVHSFTLSSHLFFCLPRFLPPLTVPCRMVFARPSLRVT